MLPPPPGSQLEVELALVAAAERSPRSELASLIAAVNDNNRRDPRYAQVQRLKMSSQDRFEEQDPSSPGREEDQGASPPEHEEDVDASMQEGEEEQNAPSSPAVTSASGLPAQWRATDFETGKENFMVSKNQVPFQQGVKDPQITWEQRARFRSWVTTDRLCGVEEYNAGPGRLVGCLHCAEKGRDCVVQYDRAKCVPCDTLHSPYRRFGRLWGVCSFPGGFFYATREKEIPAGARPAKPKRARRTSKKQPVVASASASRPRTRGRAAKDTPSEKSLGKRRVREPSVDVQGEAGPSMMQDVSQASLAPAPDVVVL
ncbi:hypothetical protein PLICRDRAFT_180414 [Plicaturopsis crispa FD-325 SS-3]|uniref:Uncharacterized protein n=1 Tax=Plicaturopsis crispa FD-325 SS-3 TaxID=944288 RepID=A0A0C9SQ99_PLICR|nr:hypothetical protein PLICRDRAFT_180414 [Plicaturopsis crispa FD-325 SS-3]